MIAEMSSDIKIFKLNYSGSFEEIFPEVLLNQLSLFNILILYVPNQKKMYVWIGKRVSHTLKSLIPKIRSAISQEHPDLQILRNITIESGLEPPEFLEIIGLEGSILKSRIKELELKLLPVLSEINRLKSKADEFFISNNYEDAINSAQNIIRLAKTINDESLEQDQINFIIEARSRARAMKRLQDIEVYCKEATNEFDRLVKDGKYQDAQKLVEDLKQRYDSKNNLSRIPLAQQLLLKNENLTYRLKIEQETILKDINDFIISFGINSGKPNMTKMSNVRESIIKECKKFLNDKISTKLKQVDNIYYKAKESLVTTVSQLSELAFKDMENGEISKAINRFEEIVHNLDVDSK